MTLKIVYMFIASISIGMMVLFILFGYNAILKYKDLKQIVNENQLENKIHSERDSQIFEDLSKTKIKILSFLFLSILFLIVGIVFFIDFLSL